MFVPFVCNLYIMIFTDAPMEICCSIIAPGDVLCFGTMPAIENRENKSALENAKALKHVFKSKMKSMNEEKWKNKALRGQYPKILEKPHLDIVTTNKWLSSNLKGETEGLLVAAHDQTINTRNYQKVICGQQVESKCRMCSQHEETVLPF